jgi:hypothetical protein
MKSKVLWLVISLVVLVLGSGLYFAFKTGLINPSADESGVTMSLSPSSGTFDVGTSFSVDIKLDSGVATSGAQAFLDYDATQLEVKDADSSTAGTQIVAGNMFDNYTTNTVSGSRITIVASNNPDVLFVGSGTFGTINFKVIGTNTSNVSFDFSPGDLTKTGVFEPQTGVNILTSATGASFTVNVPTVAPTVDLKINNSDGTIEIESGASATLSWTSQDATSCSASDDWSGDKPLSGEESTGDLTANKLFTLTCANGANYTSESVSVNIKNVVLPNPTVDLKADGSDGPIEIANGASATLSWTSVDAENCVVSNDWQGDSKPLSGEESTGNLTESKIFTLTCRNGSVDATDSVTVNVRGAAVPKPTVNLKINNSSNPIALNSGQQATLSWTTINAASCSASGSWTGSKAKTGSESTGSLSESKTYTLTCKNSSGSRSDSVSVSVNGTPPPPPVPSPTPSPVVKNTPKPPFPIAKITPEPAPSVTTSAPDSSPIAKIKPVAKQIALYKGGVVKKSVMWFFYAIIPLSLTAGVVYLFMMRKKKINQDKTLRKLNSLDNSNNNNWKNI